MPQVFYNGVVKYIDGGVEFYNGMVKYINGGVFVMAVLVSNGEGSGIEGVGACNQKMKYLSMKYMIEILPNQA